MRKRDRVLLAWLKCEVQAGKHKGDAKVVVTSKVHREDGKPETVSHYVPKDRIHTNGKAVFVTVFSDHQGYWVRFPTSAPYRPFRVAKDQLRKAGGGNPA